MADGFVQQDARPARTKNDFHRSRRGINRSKLQDGLSRAFAGESARIEIASEHVQSAPAATTLISRLALTIFLGNTHYVKPDQRLQIPRGTTVGRDNQDVFRLVDITGLDLLDARVIRAGRLVALLQ